MRRRGAVPHPSRPPSSNSAWLRCPLASTVTLFLPSPVTVLEVIQRSTEFLARKGVESPRLQVELLLAHVLKMVRMKLYLNFDRRLTDPELEALRALIKRRGEREPLQHIVGSVSFCGFEFRVNREVLIPRPETELLAERAWKFAESYPSPTVLDFGAGSGCLGITIALKVPAAMVHAVDISEAALATARENAAHLGAGERVRFQLSDGFAALPSELKFDLLVSNPPYIATAEIPTLDPEVRDYDPRLALDGGTDGLDFYRRLAGESRTRIRSGGKLMVELGAGQDGDVSRIFTNEGWTVEGVEKDYAGLARILIARPGV